MGTIHTPPYVDNDISSGNRVMAAWLNDVNTAVYSILGDGVTAPTTALIALTNMFASATSLATRQLLLLDKAGADIASAATLNLDNATGDLIDVTGTTSITAITLAAGVEKTVRFTGALTLTNGASLVLPTSANIVTQAGDVAVFRGYAAGVVRCVTFQPIVGLPTAFTWGSFTRSTAAGGVQTVTGVNFLARAVILLGSQTVASSQASIGLDTGGSSRGCIYNSHATGANTWTPAGPSYSVFIDQGVGVSYSGGITAFRYNEFDITWTRTGGAAGTVQVDYLALR